MKHSTSKSHSLFWYLGVVPHSHETCHLSINTSFPFMILSFAHVVLALPGTSSFDSLPGKFKLILKARFEYYFLMKFSITLNSSIDDHPCWFSGGCLCGYQNSHQVVLWLWFTCLSHEYKEPRVYLLILSVLLVLFK